MLVSELDVATVKNYLRVDGAQDDALIGMILDASKQFATSYTGLNEFELDAYADVPMAILCVCADLYEVRAWTMNSVVVNPTAEQILSSHAINYI